MNPQNLSPEIIAAAVGAVLGFVFAVLANLISQAYLDRRAKVQLTFSQDVETPLNISQDELKKKLEIYYNGRAVKEIYYAKLIIKNTGRKTVRKQTFSCVFDENSKSIDASFPIITTIPQMEVPIKSIPPEGSNNHQSNRYRYMIDAIAPGQTIQIEFLRDGTDKSFGVPFAPNETDEVKTIEGDFSSDPGMEVYIVQIALNYFLYVAILRIGNGFGFIFGGSIFGAFLALPFLYNAFLAFRKLVPLFIKSNLLRNNIPSSYQINMEKDSNSGVVIGEGSVTINHLKSDDNDNDGDHAKPSERQGN